MYIVEVNIPTCMENIFTMISVLVLCGPRIGMDLHGQPLCWDNILRLLFHFRRITDGELLIADKIGGVIYKITDVSTTAVETDLARLYDFQLTPIPNDGNYTVRFNSIQPESFTVNLYDYTGRKIWNEKKEAIAGQNEWTFTNPELSTGYYYLQIQSLMGHQRSIL
jgi:hypothetical protein